MRNHFLIAAGLFFIAKPCFSQEADLFNLDIISLEDKTAQNPYDFEPLKEIIADKRIVLLGVAISVRPCQVYRSNGATLKDAVK
jgi:hypothetical protein